LLGRVGVLATPNTVIMIESKSTSSQTSYSIPHPHWITWYTNDLCEKSSKDHDETACCGGQGSTVVEECCYYSFWGLKNCLNTQGIKAVDFLDMIWVPNKDAGLVLYSPPNPETVQKYLPSTHLAHAPV
jgi:hypothetical protein